MSRWRWIRRPKWMAILAVLAVFLGWLFWPVTVYEVVGRTRGFGITLPGSSERTRRSINVMPFFEGPWETRKRLKDSAGEKPNLKVREIGDLGDCAFWIGDDPGSLNWVRGNIRLALNVRGPIEEHDEGSPGWITTCERIARDTDAAFMDGRAGTKEIRPHHIPRGTLWLREQIDDRRRKAGVRTDGWWKDW